MGPTRRSAAAEARRLAALYALDLLDSAPEREFDALVALAASMLACPSAMITLIDADRQWVKAQHGSSFGETTRSAAFCNHTIRQTRPMVVEDAAADRRFADSPLVAGPVATRFYAGAPIRARGADGELYAIGAICVADTAPRALSAEGEAALGHFAAIAEALITARATAIAAVEMANESERQAAALARQKLVFEQAERLAMIGSWRLELATEELSWSDQVFRIHDLPHGQFPSLDDALNFYPPPARAVVAANLARIMETGEPFDFETDFTTAGGERRRVRSQAEVERDSDGRAVAIIGVFQDISAQYLLEERLRQSADTDFLTGIANRAAFDTALEAAMERARTDGTPLGLAIVDLDGFKRINDTFGHDVGDDALRAIAERLRAPWLVGCRAGRLGGDEFAVIIEHPAFATDPEAFAERLSAWLRITLDVEGMPVLVCGSVGGATHDGRESMRDLLRRADAALYRAKRDRIGQRRVA